MPSADDVFAELETARALRESEVRLLQNLAAIETTESGKLALRRSLVLVAYAHLEGFCKTAMEMYVATLNSMKMPCSEVVPPLVAATLHRAFGALRDTNTKHPLFRKRPDDSSLHMAWREHQFAESISGVLSAVVEIPDATIDTESNLKPDVLKRNMYRLGLNFDAVEGERASIHELVGRRNEIAHGELVEPSAENVDAYVATAFKVMQFVQSEVYEALYTEAFRKKAAA